MFKVDLIYLRCGTWDVVGDWLELLGHGSWLVRAIGPW